MTDNQSEWERVAGVSRRSFIAAAGTVGVAGLAGCTSSFGGDDDGGDGISGTITATGSNTVAPITDRAGETFMDEYPDASVDVDPQGTGAGFSEFVQGNSDVQSASRMISEEERADAEANGVGWDYFEVGTDGLAVVKNAENDWLEEITLDELKAVWEFESDIELWSDIRDEYPDEEILLHARDSASGTFDYFTENIIGEVGLIRDDYSATSQTNEIMDAVAGNQYAFGWGGVGYYHAIADDQPIEAVPVESDVDGEFYPPEEEYIEDGVYSPMARPLFIFLSHYSLEDRPNLIGSFARFYFNGQREFAPQEGFYASPPEMPQENHDKLDAVLEDLGVEDQVDVQPDV
ncbi:PstS family phosphate ABC transporter substrate-binding protein [Natronobiforma cellulositropha]|uniref:PstS family phosphate ABC transporter substrate-binding protein n=1 Tax=Natronobiforma cellulositropha TaxID=1679076 RepID=UPI0021D5F626|nr:PstS family phosphate ABC transporter substrate-binding protein [Natronobiforma cellulositropha]